MDFDGRDEEEEEEGGDIGDLPPSGGGGGGGSSYVDTPPLPQPHRLNSSTFPSTLACSKQELTGNVAAVPAASRKTGCGDTSGRYRECLKNHAVGIGGHAVDGCGEFMAAGEEGTLEGLKCAACNCHRNFHRKEALEGVGAGLGMLGIGDTNANTPSSAFHHPHQPQLSPYYRTPSGYLHQNQYHHMAPPRLALPSTSGGGGSRDDQEDLSDPMVGGGSGGAGGGTTSSRGVSSKKRFRTKFTQEQKDKMLELADKLGWRMQKHDETSVQQFCAETGVQRHVLKVWMHNNKLTLGKSPTTTPTLIQQVPQTLHLQDTDHHHHHPQIVDQHQIRSSGERET